MDASSTFWFPAICTLLGCLFPIFSFALAFYLAVARRVLVIPQLDEIICILEVICERLAHLQVVQRDVEALTMALTPHGESIAEALSALRELSTGLLALASTNRETFEAVTGLKTDLQAPATPVPVSYTHLTLPTNREV